MKLMVIGVAATHIDRHRSVWAKGVIPAAFSICKEESRAAVRLTLAFFIAIMRLVTGIDLEELVEYWFWDGGEPGILEMAAALIHAIGKMCLQHAKKSAEGRGGGGYSPSAKQYIDFTRIGKSFVEIASRQSESDHRVSGQRPWGGRTSHRFR